VLEAADYLDCASAEALTVRPLLVVMTGLSGTGKSTVARRLARALGASRFTSDIVRKELAGVEGPAPAAWGEGIYRPEWTAATYDRLFALAGERPALGQPVVLDATFLDASLRDRAAAVAAGAGARLLLVETVCDETTVAARMATRAAGGNSPSDATLATFQRQRAAARTSPPPIPDGALHVQVDTAAGVPVLLDQVFATLASEGMILPLVPAAAWGAPIANARE
jgi:predicted kinase